MKFSIFQFLVLFLLASACQYFTPGDNQSSQVIATVGEEALTSSDLSKSLPIGMSVDDSAKFAKKFINDWVKRQLIVNKALEEFAVDEEAIEIKIKEYRDALIVHEFEKLYVNSHLNTDVDSAEIALYYDDNKDNFILKQNILRCLFAKVPKSSPGVNQLRRNMRAYPNSNKADIESYCLQYALNSFLDDSLWVNFEELIVGTPLQQIDDKIRWLGNTEFSETRDDNFIYMVRVIDYKISNQLSPLDFIKEDIESIIINKRKLDLKRELEATIYEDASKNNGYEIISN